MFFPPIFAACSAYAPFTALVGTNPVRLHPFGEAPQTPTKPYVVWQVIGGSPEKYLGTRPDIDRFIVQVDCYGDTAASARNVAQALRDAIEPVSYVVSFRGEAREPETALYRVSIDLEWLVDTATGGANSWREDDWSTPTMLNGWTNFGNGYQPAQYRRQGDRVDIRMVVTGGTAPGIFTLPADCRPPSSIGFTAQVHDKTDNPDFGHIRVHHDTGLVELEHHGNLNQHKVWAVFSFSVS